MSKEVHRIYFCKDGSMLDTQIREGEDVTDTLKRCFKKIADLEAKLKALQNGIIDDETLSRLVREHKLYKDLEAKLAESESKVAVGRFWHSAYEGKQLDYDKLNNDYNKQEKLLSDVLADKSKLQFEFDQLKQQLAEKDEQLNSAQVGEEFALKCCDEANKLLALQVAGQRQDKISFALEQLEKVKEIMSKSNESGYIIRFASMNDRDKFNEIIDNQIKQLKEMK